MGTTDDLIASWANETVHIPGRGAVAVHVSGPEAAPAVVLVHGFASSAYRTWRFAATELATSYRVVAPNLPGFGGSPALPGGFTVAAAAEDLAVTLDALEIRSATFVAHSFGNHPAITAAARHAGLASAYVACMGARRHDDLELRLLRARRLRPLTGPLLLALYDVQRWRKGGLAWSEYRKADRTTLLETAIAMSESDITDAAAGLWIPTRNLVARHDARVPVPVQEALLPEHLVYVDDDHGAPWHGDGPFVGRLVAAVDDLHRA
jgi:pimeloyl-ACP methyl ester carboxylesterase